MVFFIIYTPLIIIPWLTDLNIPDIILSIIFAIWVTFSSVAIWVTREINQRKLNSILFGIVAILCWATVFIKASF